MAPYLVSVTCVWVAAGCLLPAVEVAAGPLRLEPYGQMLFQNGRFELHPTASAGIGYDSNLDGNGASDSFVHGTIGGIAHWYANPDLDLEMALETGNTRFREFTQRNTQDADGRISAIYTGPAWTTTADVNGARGREAEPITGEQVLRNRYGLGSVSERMDEGLYARLGVGFDRVAYLEDTTLFLRDQGGRLVSQGEIKLGWRTHTETRLYALSRIRQIVYDDEGRFRNGTLVDVGAGLGSRIVPTVTASAEIGASFARFSAPAFDDPAYDDAQVTSPFTLVSARWEWEPGSTLTARASHTLSDGRTANAITRTLVGGDAEYRLRSRLSAFADAALSREKDSGAAAGNEPALRRISEAAVGVRGTITPGIGFQVRTEWSRVSDAAGGGYDRHTIEGTLGFAF